LDTVRNNLNGEILLMNDLDSATDGYTELASPTANEGQGWLPIGIWPDPFTGSFDGQGFEIKDLFIDRPGATNVGLFSFVNEGAIVEDVAVTDVDVTGDTYVGGLAGHSRGNLSNCHSTGIVTGDTYVGGLVGENGGIVSNSSSTASASGSFEVGGLIGQNHATVRKSYSTGSATGDSYVGGLVGWNKEGSLSDSYSSASVNGELLAGGLAGSSRATVVDCYSTGTVTGLENVGGLLGRSYEGTTSDSFWDIETSGQATSDGGTGNTTAEMQDIATFSGAGWDIVALGSVGERDTAHIWNMVDDATYPFLSWQPVG
jgi:hypothetical protein